LCIHNHAIAQIKVQAPPPAQAHANAHIKGPATTRPNPGITALLHSPKISHNIAHNAPPATDHDAAACQIDFH